MIKEKRKFTARTIVHSEEYKGVQEIEMYEYSDGTYEAVTKSGIRCSAIFNWFTWLFYADDIYGIIEEKKY